MRSLIFSFILIFSAFRAEAITNDSLEYGVFGKIRIFHPKEKPIALVLFISGDGGWNLGVTGMAKNLSLEGAMVAGIDIRHYLKAVKSQKASCYYPASDFEDLSLSLQKKYKFPKYLKPILVGYSSGATMVYAMLAQAPANTFKGGIALGFCPDISLDRPPCAGNGLVSRVLKPGKSFYLEKTSKLSAPLFVLNGTADQVCPYPVVEAYLKNLANATLISASEVGHGFAKSSKWMPQFRSAFHKLADKSPKQNPLSAIATVRIPAVNHVLPSGLPLTLVTTSKNNNDLVAIFLSGDGGWTSFDQSIASQLAKKGIPVIGLDTQQYFWSRKTPEKTTMDISAVLNHYMQLWRKKNAFLIGYSFGADIIPFVARRLSGKLRQNLKGIALLSPEPKADFEIHITDMLNIGSRSGAYDVISEVKQINDLGPVCFFGSKESSQVSDQFRAAGLKIVMLPGGHHYDDNVALVADRMMVHLKK